MNNKARILTILILSAVPLWGLDAQVERSAFMSTTSTSQSTSNYYYAKPNEITIIASVVGHVVRPGRYEISKSIDLVNLIALAGGPSPEGTLSDLKIQRIVETPGGPRIEVLELNLEDPSAVDPDDRVISPGDVIMVGRSGWAGFKDVFSVIVGAAAIVIAVSYVIIATDE